MNSKMNSKMNYRLHKLYKSSLSLLISLTLTACTSVHNGDKSEQLISEQPIDQSQPAQLESSNEPSEEEIDEFIDYFVDDTYTDNNIDNNTGIDTNNPKAFTLSNGTYKVETIITNTSDSISAGTYNIEAISGYGSLIVYKDELHSTSISIGISDYYPNDKEYKNLTLTSGNKICIENGVVLEFSKE